MATSAASGNSRPNAGGGSADCRDDGSVERDDRLDQISDRGETPREIGLPCLDLLFDRVREADEIAAG